MIDVVENAVQLAVLAVCFTLSAIKAVRGRDRMWVILSFFYGCSFFSLLYYTCYLVVFGYTPKYSYVSDMGWMASYIFLIILLVEFDAKRQTSAPVRAAWIFPAICVPACILFCTHGDILLNLIDCSLMAAIGYLSVRGIAFSLPFGSDESLALHIAIMAFAVVELILWTTSCFWNSQNYLPYVVADYAFTASYAAILVCARKTSLE